MTLAYKVEELLALRDSVSESAVSIEKFADEEVIKEHVLRPSASASAHLTGKASNNSLQPPNALPVAPIAPAGPQKKSSPSPSIKRGKAEKLLKEHGSPPGMRVTAGGRVVPSDLLPLGISRYSDANHKQQTLHATSGNIAAPQVQMDNAARIEIIGGQPVVVIGDRMYTLPSVSDTPVMALNTTGSLGSMTKQPSESVPVMLSAQRTQNQPAFTGLDLGTLRSQQVAKKKELRTVEQAEVLQAGHQSEAWRASMIEKKRALIVELDSLRKQIAALENEVPNSFPGPIGAMHRSTPSPSFLSTVSQLPAQAVYPYPATNPYAPVIMYQHPYDAYPGFAGVEHVPFAGSAIHTPHSPGSASRRSHAIEIKPPPEEHKRQTLDPKSPTYEPAGNSAGTRIVATSANPVVPQRSSWTVQEVEQSIKTVSQALSHKPSLSSVDTTDFFPTNTHEHSTTRLAPNTNEVKQATAERSLPPMTPEQTWPASPWNEGNSSRSRKDGPGTSLASWPETFGTHHSSSSLRRNGMAQPSPALHSRSPILGGLAGESVTTKLMSFQSGSPRRNWSDEFRQAARKVNAPSTYQEGYQAGYDHFGIPHNSEVLQGYVQGLVQFLSDEANKAAVDGNGRELYVRGVESRTPSLRGLVADSLPLDSGAASSLQRSNSHFGGQENAVLRKSDFAAGVAQATAYGPQEGGFKIPVSHALLNSSSNVSRSRNVPTMMQSTSPSLFPEKTTKTRQAASTYRDESEMNMPSRIKATPPYTGSSSLVGGLRQLSVNQLQNQLQNHGYGTPLSLQRFSIHPQDHQQKGFLVNTSAEVSFANYRPLGLDGAMDDLAEMTAEGDSGSHQGVPGDGSTEVPMRVETEEPGASCFKSSGKSKQKAAESPKRTSKERPEKMMSSPANAGNSPKKSGEQSPTKVKLEQVTNKFRRNKKDDPRTLSPEDKMKRSEKWRQRFQHLKRMESEEIQEYHRTTRK